MLLLIPQRYEFSSKSQHCWYTYNTDFGCCWYHKGTNFQANHNITMLYCHYLNVVADTTKVRIFKQITTDLFNTISPTLLLLIPQRYEFSSKSQLNYSKPLIAIRCCWYHKGTNFQANHNIGWYFVYFLQVVADTTKVRIFKQITTPLFLIPQHKVLLLIPQRYEFSSKSQHIFVVIKFSCSCCWYHKGTNFQANHNNSCILFSALFVVADTTKVRIFKQITTALQTLLLVR